MVILKARKGWLRTRHRKSLATCFTVYGGRYNEYTGYSLALNSDGDVAAVGSTGNNMGVTLSGSVHVYGYDQDSDGVANIQDAFPQDPTETIDTDGDGTGNNADTDDDGDGYVDAFEDFAGADSLIRLTLKYRKISRRRWLCQFWT